MIEDGSLNLKEESAAYCWHNCLFQYTGRHKLNVLGTPRRARRSGRQLSMEYIGDACAREWEGENDRDTERVVGE